MWAMLGFFGTPEVRRRYAHVLLAVSRIYVSIHKYVMHENINIRGTYERRSDTHTHAHTHTHTHACTHTHTRT